tara:strand:+ start:345 stop:1103 length:759 start_codon:yes stop_codon:yes gene_type:complete
MKFKLLSFLILFNFVSSEECHPEADWCFNQAINFAFYIFEEANLNGIELNRGILETDGSVSCPNDDCDTVGAFNGDVCVGWSTYYINDGLDNKFTLAVNGYDGNDYSAGYLLNGQMPNFKFFDSSTGEIIDAESNIEVPMFQNFGGFIMGELNAETDNISDILNPNKFMIQSIFPNPFNPNTQVNYSLKNSENIYIYIYDITGKIVQKNNLGLKSSGDHFWIWNANPFSSGIFFIELKSKSHSKTQKVVLVK